MCTPLKWSHNWARIQSFTQVFHSFWKWIIAWCPIFSIRLANVLTMISAFQWPTKQKQLSMKNPDVLFINFNISKFTFNQNVQWVLSQNRNLCSNLFTVPFFWKLELFLTEHNNWAVYNQVQGLLWENIGPLSFFFFFLDSTDLTAGIQCIVNIIDSNMAKWRYKFIFWC